MVATVRSIVLIAVSMDTSVAKPNGPMLLALARVS